MSGKRGAQGFGAPSLKRHCTDSSQTVQKVLKGPACPGIVKTRQQGSLSKLPPGSDVFEAFAKVRADKELSDEEAFLEFLATYDVPLSSLSRLSGNPFLPLIKAMLCSHDYSREARCLALEHHL